MESPAPAGSGVGSTAEVAGRLPGVAGMAGTLAPGSSIGAAQQGGLAGLREQVGNQASSPLSSSTIGQPPKG
jgi:hypothetical protein